MAWGNGSSHRTSTAAHKARRTRVLARDHHTCQIRGPRCTKIGNICDHIINIEAGGTESDDNCQAVCKPCHDAKTATEAHTARTARRGRLRLPTEPHPGMARTDLRSQR